VSTAKQLGAYYTDERVASFVVRWALRAGSGARTVLDPSCGDGVFLGAACRALAGAGVELAMRVLGVDIDPKAAAAARGRLTRDRGLRRWEVVVGDFFDIPCGTWQVHAVVGNPPFVRFHRFAGNQRTQALARAAEQGVRLSGLSSSWAPFVVHSVGMLAPGGQLGMVLPRESTHAVYARPVIRHLLTSFAEVTVVTFRHPLFPNLNEDTVLLLARDRGHGPGPLACLDLDGVDDLSSVRWKDTGSVEGARPIASEGLAKGDHPVPLQLLPSETVALWSRLSADPRLARLGDLVSLGIGYVTGANGFFHLSREEATAWSIPGPFLADAVVRSRALTGLSFTASDWEAGLAHRCTSYLLHVNGASDLPPGLLAYLHHGEAMGIPRGYKCRNRQPWYSVPQVVPPDAFLTYMSHDMPRIVANACGAVAPNTLHCVQMRPQAPLAAAHLALLWCNSLTRLSAEIEGHALGGGMLKLEPGEARRVLVPPLPTGWQDAAFSPQFAALDELLRAGRHGDVRERVDEAVLGAGMGLMPQDWRVLSEGARVLRQRRLHRPA